MRDVFISNLALFASCGLVRNTIVGISLAIRRNPFAILTFTPLNVNVNLSFSSEILLITGSIFALYYNYIIIFINQFYIYKNLYIKFLYNEFNGATYIILENGQEILLPPTITKVPALLLLSKNHHVLFGNDINNHIESTNVVHTNQIVKMNGEPLAFSLNNGGYGVASDNYSFLDQDASDLSAKGDGGMRQQHHYATLDYNSNIETPPDNYQPDKVGQVTLEQLQQNRNSEIQKK